MSQELQLAQDLIEFIYQSASPFHAAHTIKKRLLNHGFQELCLRSRWKIEKGGKYFISKNNSAVVAFVVGTGELEQEGYRLVGAHTDAPSLRVKPSPEITVENSYLKLNTETYGGPILNTWLDRPLALAGRVSLRSEKLLRPRVELVNINKPLMVIPNIAIHLNRKLNEGVELNKQKDMQPLLTLISEGFEKDGFLIKLLAEELQVEPDAIIDFELFLYDYQKGSVVGLNNEFISCGKLDDLAMVHAGISALIEAEPAAATQVMACFDNEEVGSSTKQGAGSPMLSTVLERIAMALGKDREDFYRSLYSSFLISADMAHALHPNAPDKHDPVNRPILNKGPVIKINANQAYTTDSQSDAVFEMLCEKAGVPVQKFVNRSDMRGGSTIGPISARHLDISSLDIGNPMLAMHSIRELAGVLDHWYLKQVLKAYYSL